MSDPEYIERIKRNEVIVDLLEKRLNRKADDDDFVVDLFKYLFPSGVVITDEESGDSYEQESNMN